MSSLQNSSNHSLIKQFYEGKTVLVTGGTGYLGKVIIEKLLYSCDVENIYVLVREKKGITAEQRIENIVNSVLCQRLRDEKPDALKKIIPISGDITEENIGLNEHDLKRVIETVSVVLHSAASVSFTQSLKEAIKINIGGTANVTNLCKQMSNLQALVHVSTMYCNIDKNITEEVVYPTPCTLDELHFFVQQYSDGHPIIKELIGKLPNAYTFTKKFSEIIVANERGDMPRAIVRPSIVTGCAFEPIPGWIDNWNGPSGIMYSMATGVSKVTLAAADVVGDLVPVDMVSNIVIAAAVTCKRSPELEVYNFTSSVSNPMTWRTFRRVILSTAKKNNINRTWFQYTIYTTSIPLYNILAFFLQTVPTQIADWISMLLGERPRYMKMLARLYNVEEALRFFKVQGWNFSDENTRRLLNHITEYDRKVFNFDVKTIEWDSYIEHYVTGVHKYLNN